MGYLHVDIIEKQTSKVAGDPCGDVIGYHRDDVGTTIVISDGLGSGVKANIAANMCIARTLELLKSGTTLKEAFQILVSTMNNAWGTDKPFAVFTLARIIRNGDATIFTYEMPPPVIVNSYSGSVLRTNTKTIEKAICYESHCSLKNGEALLLVSDGITQAGLGNGLVNGWEIKGVATFITSKLLKKSAGIREIPELVHDEARRYWRKSKGDDCSVAMALCRNGVVVNLITGPPSDKSQDERFVKEFLNNQGIKIVCGGSTAKMVARIKKSSLSLKENTGNAVTPPEYEIDSINCVTEGAVTLNQVYNIIDEDITDVYPKTGVHALADFLNIADKINFWIGDAPNDDIDGLAFKQQHILSRKVIVELLVEKLRKKGKLVICR